MLRANPSIVRHALLNLLPELARLLELLLLALLLLGLALDELDVVDDARDELLEDGLLLSLDVRPGRDQGRGGRVQGAGVLVLLLGGREGRGGEEG